MENAPAAERKRRPPASLPASVSAATSVSIMERSSGFIMAVSSPAATAIAKERPVQERPGGHAVRDVAHPQDGGDTLLPEEGQSGEGDRRSGVIRADCKRQSVDEEAFTRKSQRVRIFENFADDSFTGLFAFGEAVLVDREHDCRRAVGALRATSRERGSPLWR